MSNSIPTAAALRAYYQADPKRIARLSEKAAHTVRKGARGHVHPEAVAKARGAVKAYAVGNSKKVSQAAHDEAKSIREAARQAGLTVGERGPLPAAVKALASTSKS
jgi:hypothetical protein